jgi:hypothetical protein
LVLIGFRVVEATTMKQIDCARKSWREKDGRKDRQMILNPPVYFVRDAVCFCGTEDQT